MPRSGAAARHRIQQAALDLYRERGFDQTTTAEIAARAGVTERTFFRHFLDKREVLFDGEAALHDLLAKALNELPATAAPLIALLHAFRSVVPLLEHNRPFTEPRAQVIDVTPALRERALSKTASLTTFLTTALQARGVPDTQAALAARIGLAAFNQAATLWFQDATLDLDTLLVQAFGDLHTLCLTGR